MKITILVESEGRPIPFAARPERYRRFADELGRFAGTKVEIVKDALAESLADGYLLWATSGAPERLLSRCGSLGAARLAARTVLLDVSWQKALGQLEEYRFAGAVDSLRLSEWLARPSSNSGPFGLRYLVRALGVSCNPLPALQSKHYCLLESERHQGLPHLLVDYLTAYDRDQTPLDTLPSVALVRLPVGLKQWAPEAGRVLGGRGDRVVSTSQVEFVSTKRAIASIKRVRELSGLALQQVAESAGLDPESVGLLEKGDYRRVTLGMLREYVLALEGKWGWTLAEVNEVGVAGRQKPSGRPQTVAADGPHVLASGPLPEVWHVPAVGAVGMAGVIQGGMTVLRAGRTRRRGDEGEIDKPLARRHEEEFYAGV